MKLILLIARLLVSSLLLVDATHFTDFKNLHLNVDRSKQMMDTRSSIKTNGYFKSNDQRITDSKKSRTNRRKDKNNSNSEAYTQIYYNNHQSFNFYNPNSSLHNNDPLNKISVFPNNSNKNKNIVTMLSVNQVINTVVSKDVKLQCEFHMKKYFMFNNPVIWMKRQNATLTTINTQGVIHSPFVETKRFSASFDNGDDNRYNVLLIIKNVQLEDTGNYTCELRNRDATVLSHVTHVIYVAGLIYSISFKSTTPTNLTNLNKPTTIPSILFTQNDTKVFQCRVNSSCPQVKMSFYMGKEILSGQEQWKKESISMVGETGLERMHCIITKWIKITFTHKHDDKILRCTTRQTLVHPFFNSSYINVHVQYSPRISCNRAMLRRENMNITLKCIVTSKPDITSLFWAALINNALVDTRLEHKNTVLEKTKLITQLFVTRGNVGNRYVVEVSNSIGTTKNTIQIELISARINEFDVRSYPGNRHGSRHRNGKINEDDFSHYYLKVQSTTSPTVICAFLLYFVSGYFTCYSYFTYLI